MRNTGTYFALLLLPAFFSVTTIFAQKRVVIMGSSTAYGGGATAYEFSWAGRLEGFYNQNNSDGSDTLFYNIAAPGLITYQEMPTGFIPPADRPYPDQERNVTKALSYNPDVVIINLPNNDLGEGYTKTETMSNFRHMFSTIIATGARCYIASPQPRNDYDAAQRQTLRELVDSVYFNFGLHSINFWDTIVTKDGSNLIREDVKDPATPMHVNDLGHLYLFQKVLSKKIFDPEGGPLPLRLTNFQAQLKNNSVLVSWHTELQDPNTTFELQRSRDGYNFYPLYSLYVPDPKQSADYNTTDLRPLPGKNFYRLKINSPAKKSYSGILSVSRKQPNLDIIALYKNSASTIIADIIVSKNQMVAVNITSVSGAIILQRKQYLSIPSTELVLPVSKLTAGQYYFSITCEDGSKLVKAFSK